MPAETPTPDALINALTAHGWTVVGKGAHHVRLRYGGMSRSYVVPTEPEAPEHEEMMSAVLADLAGEAERGRHAQGVLDALRPEVERD